MVTLRFKRRNIVSKNANSLLSMFVHDWLLDMCGVDRDITAIPPRPNDSVLSFQFAYSEDAIIIKLKGVPGNLNKYIEIC